MLSLSIGLLLASLIGGIAIGAIAGLLPGVHVNNTSAILLGLSPALAASGVPALYIAIAIVTSTISQSFLDIVPSIFLGAPDDATALAVMPGHRMLLDGRGIEAVRLSAAGSGLAIVVSMLLIVPVSLIFLFAYPYMWGCMALILAAISAFIILSNKERLGVSGGFGTHHEDMPRRAYLYGLRLPGHTGICHRAGAGPDRKHRGTDSIATATIRPLRGADAAHEHAERACYPPAGAQRFQPSRDGDREIGRPRHPGLAPWSPGSRPSAPGWPRRSPACSQSRTTTQTGGT